MRDLVREHLRPGEANELGELVVEGAGPEGVQLGEPAADPGAELAAADQAIAGRFPPPPPPPPPPAAPADPADEADELGAGVEGLAQDFVARPELLELLTADEFAGLYELAFGFVAEKTEQPHWELPPKSAARLGKWTRQVVLRHPELAAWLAQHLADLVLGLLVVLEVGQRVVRSQRLKRQQSLEAGDREGGARDDAAAAR